MKKIWFLVLSLLLTMAVSVPAFAAAANPTPARVLVNGKEETFQAYEIYGYTYFKLRDIDAALDDTKAGFELQYDKAKNAVFLTKGPFFYGEGPDELPAESSVKEARYSGQKIYLDGVQADVDAFLIDGYNYFKLRDLSELLGFSVEWNSAEKVISITAEQVSPYSDDKKYKKKAKEEKDKLEKETENLGDEEKYLFIRINDDRAKRGLEKLELDEKLTQAAEIRAEEIRKTYSHMRPDGTAWYTVLQEVGASCDAAAENLAYGFTSSKDVLNGWLGYEPYRENMQEKDYEKIGVGFNTRSDTWVAIFAED